MEITDRQKRLIGEANLMNELMAHPGWEKVKQILMEEWEEGLAVIRKPLAVANSADLIMESRVKMIVVERILAKIGNVVNMGLSERRKMESLLERKEPSSSVKRH